MFFAEEKRIDLLTDLPAAVFAQHSANKTVSSSMPGFFHAESSVIETHSFGTIRLAGGCKQPAYFTFRFVGADGIEPPTYAGYSAAMRVFISEMLLMILAN